MSRPRLASDAEIVDTVATLYAAGEVIQPAGGVTPARLADDIGMSKHTATDHLRRLHREEELEQAIGIENGCRKVSYCPVGDPDGV